MTIAICTWNRAAYLRECVLSVLQDCRSLPGPWEVMVVDNGSTDETAHVLSELSAQPGVTTLRESRRGLSHARNTAVAHARGKIVVFLDDDVLVPSGYAQAIRAAFDVQAADIVGGPVLPRWESRPPFWFTPGYYGVLGLLPNLQLVEGRGYPRIFGANMAFRREVLAGLGDAPFSPKLGRSGTRLLGGEESLLISNLHQRGTKVVFAEHALVYHRVPAHRLTIGYFLRYMYDGGRSDGREWQIRTGEVKLPRWVIGELIERAVEVPLYLCLGRPTDCVASLLRFSWRLGRVVEYVQTRFRRRESKTHHG